MREMNRIPPRMALREGSTVLVPRSEKHNADVPEHIADNGQILLAPEVRERSVRSVQVRAGDTLASIARQQKVSVANLRKWNKLSGNPRLKAGQTLVVQIPATSKSVAKGTGNKRTQAKAPAKRTVKVVKKSSGKPTVQAKTKSAVAAR